VLQPRRAVAVRRSFESAVRVVMRTKPDRLGAAFGERREGEREE